MAKKTGRFSTPAVWLASRVDCFPRIVIPILALLSTEISERLLGVSGDYLLLTDKGCVSVAGFCPEKSP